MTLRDLELLLIDCQTTGIRPPRAHLLEIAWATLGKDDDALEVHAHLVELPEGESIPRLVSEMTGITELSGARARGDVADALRRLTVPTALIHYAQFEKPFLADLLGDVPFEIFCSHQLAKRLFPKLPSRNIRATAGFFGPPILGHNRAGTFVRATAQIWRGLRGELEDRGVTTLEQLREFMNEKPAAKRARATGYEYRLEKMTRLKLPAQPGVYRMLAQNGEVLYVGKATSLKDRVNSYFRGKKGRDQRKLEMIAQVWDLEVTPCGSPLEAALLESDEIKRLNPPYNVMLRTGRRHLVFYDRDFTSSHPTQDDRHPIGPFRNHNWIEHLRMLARSVARGTFEQIFFDPIPPEDLAAGFAIFCARREIAPERLARVRPLLALGLRLYRAHQQADEIEEVEAAETETGEPVLTPEDVADKFERLLRRAGAELRRGRKLTGLLFAEVEIGGRRLRFTNGRLARDEEDRGAASGAPWRGLDVDAFDRMSILLTELTKRAP